MYIIDEQNISGIIENYLTTTKTDSTSFYLKAAEHLVSYIPESAQRITFFIDGTQIGTLGAAVAYLLSRADKDLILFIRASSLTEETEAFLQILEEQKAHIYLLNNVNQLQDLHAVLAETHLIVDAMAALPKTQDEFLFVKQLVQVINRVQLETLAFDFPFYANDETIITATNIVTFIAAKKCFTNTNFLTAFGQDEIHIESLDIPELYYQDKIEAQYIDQDDISDILKQKQWALTDHKYKFGHALIIAGNVGTLGAALLAGEAALKTGCGLVSLYTHPELANLVPLRTPEIMSHAYTDINNLQLDIKRASSILIGPGLGITNQSLALLELIFAQATCPIIVDADALTLIHKQPQLLTTFSYPVIFTPHAHEFARFTGLEIDEISSHRIDVAREFAKKYNVILALKGYQTIISDGITTYINTTGSSAMASAGMGDVLAGIIAAMTAKQYSSLEATISSVYLHGACGDWLSLEKDRVLATEVINEIPERLQFLY